jgi:hypothetical protein
MSDIANELRERSLRADESLALAVLVEAADEIERLRSSHATAVQRLAYEIGRLRLTDAEREAIEVAAEAYSSDHGERFAAILRGLLERTK